MLINNFDLEIPLHDKLGFIAQQLGKNEFSTNIFTMGKNEYQLDDSHYPFNPFAESKEGEYFTVFGTDQINNKFATSQNLVMKNLFIMDGSAKVHKRAVYNFLFVLADFGGF